MPVESMRRLGATSIEVSPIAMGCWPIAGVTSIDVNENDSIATLEAANAHGINFFDTAHVYGYDGESERMIGQVFAGRRKDIVIATKGGIHWKNGVQVRDASPERLRMECETSLKRLQTDYIDLLYLHAPDYDTPIEASAAALRGLLESGKAKSVGLSNASVEQMELFAAECPLTAVQPPYNMLQREAEERVIPWCQGHNVSVIAYWPLMKGLLAGRLQRDHEFDPKDGRRKYPIYQGTEWQRNQDFVDELRQMSSELGKTVAQIVLNWTIHRPGITVAIAGAKRAYQIEENANAMGWKLTDDQRERLDAAIKRRGPVDNSPAVQATPSSASSIRSTP